MFPFLSVRFASRDSRTMQCNLSNLSNSLVNIFYFTKLSVYRVELRESNVAIYTQLYKLQIRSHFKISTSCLE